LFKAELHDLVDISTQEMQPSPGPIVSVAIIQ
jgi:hypothetical protein